MLLIMDITKEIYLKKSVCKTELYMFLFRLEIVKLQLFESLKFVTYKPKL